MDAHSLIAEILRRDVTITADTPLADIDGWDSLKGVKLILRMEEISGSELAESDIEALRTVGDVDSMLRNASR